MHRSRVTMAYKKLGFFALAAGPTRIGWLIFGMLLPGLFTALSASAISGTFDMSGIVTATTTTNTWQSDVFPNTADMFTLSAGSGSFVGENGQNTIDNMNSGSEPVGVAFAPQPFIVFDVVTGLPALDINFIAAGIGGSAGCGATPAVTTPPQTCTPVIPGVVSPFTFSNNPPPSAIQSSVQFIVTGVTSDGLSTWDGIFTSQFPVPYQTVLAAFAPGGSGSVTNSYSATITVTPIPTVPEPMSLSLIGIGLVGLGVLRRRQRTIE